MYKEIYDTIYISNSEYNYNDSLFHQTSLRYIDHYFKTEKYKTILDAGCGEGFFMKHLISKGFDVYGIEVSEVCCKKYLKDYPHYCGDIKSFSLTNETTFDSVLCNGVLEHISYSDIDDTVKSLSKLSSNALFSIANHSDVQCGYELHIIQQDKDWWIETLSMYYKSVKFLSYEIDNRLFFIECSNEIQNI